MAKKKGSNNNNVIISRVSSTVSESPIVYRGKKVAADTGFFFKKLLKSTEKAAWIVGTTFLILAMSLIIEIDREQQHNELDLQ